MNQCNGRILPLRLRMFLLPLVPLRFLLPTVDWRLSAGGQTLKQTLLIREVTPHGWQAHYCAWAPCEEPYGFWVKDLPERNKGVSLRVTPVTWEPPLNAPLK